MSVVGFVALELVNGKPVHLGTVSEETRKTLIIESAQPNTHWIKRLKTTVHLFQTKQDAKRAVVSWMEAWEQRSLAVAAAETAYDNAIRDREMAAMRAFTEISKELKTA